MENQERASSYLDYTDHVFNWLDKYTHPLVAIIVSIFLLFLTMAVLLAMIVPVLIPFAILAAPYQLYRDTTQTTGPQGTFRGMHIHWTTKPFIWAHRVFTRIFLGIKVPRPSYK